MDSCTGTYSLSTFLKGISPLVTDEGVAYVCAKRRIAPQTTFFDLTEKEQDLAEGTMYYWLSNLPVGGSTEKVSDGGWSHSEGGWTVSKANIDEWMRKYRRLFDKWNEELLGSRIRILNF
jgi:hypothetical protein